MVLIKINLIVSTRACHFNFQSAHWLYVLREIKKAKKKKNIFGGQTKCLKGLFEYTYSCFDSHWIKINNRLVNFWWTYFNKYQHCLHKADGTEKKTCLSWTYCFYKKKL